MWADNYKYLTVGKLRELLAEFPDDCRVMPNAVHNLLVLSPDGHVSIAFVDFSNDFTEYFATGDPVPASLGSGLPGDWPIIKGS